MLKSELAQAQAAVAYLADTEGFDVNTVTAFVVVAKVPQYGSPQTRRPAPTIVIDSGQVFTTMKTAFGNAIANRRAAAQALLDSLEVT